MNRLWRSRSVAFIVLLLAFAMVAAACSSDDGGGDTTTTEAMETTTTEAMETTTTEAVEETTTTEPSIEKPYGGEAINGADQYPATFNGFINDNTVVSDLGNLWACGTQDISGYTLELIPEVVTELPTVANGGFTVNDDGTMTVKYTIRDEARWADGTPISGADYQFTYESIMGTELAIKTTYEDIVDTVVGDKTFEYTLSSPTLQAELLFGELLPKHAVEGTDLTEDWNESRWVTCGPFEFDSASTGEFVTATRNPNYWKFDEETGQQLPFLDSVTFRFIGETESLINAFKARELDMIQPPPSSELIETLQALEPEGAVVEVLSGPVWEHVNFQYGTKRFERNENSCVENLAFRQAIGYTIDRTVLTDEILAGQVEPLDSYVAAFAPQLSNENWNQYQADPAMAAELYAQAVAETGKECSVVFSTTSNNDARVKMSELFVGMFEEAGIPYENQLEDSTLFFGETLDTGLWDVGEWAWGSAPGLAGLVGIHDLFDGAQAPPVGQNYYNWGAPANGGYEDDNSIQFTALRDEMNTTVDQDVIIPLIAEAEAILADQMVFLPLYTRLVTAAVWGDEIGGFKHNPTSAGHLWNAEEWYRTDI